MPKNNNFIIRFGVKDKEDRCSRTWRLWTENNNVYLLERKLGHFFKASLHASGEWQISFSSEFAAKKTIKNEERHITKWSHPEDNIASGVTLAFRLLIPSSELRDYKNRPDSSKIIWLDAPKNGYAIEIAIIYTRKEVPVKGWPGKDAMQTNLLGDTTLNNGERLWLIYRDIKLSGRDIKLLQKYKEISNEISRCQFGSGILIGSEPDNSRKFMEVALI